MSEESSHQVRRIVSGGQTGVDRGALDAAIALDIEHGGWCPRGRLAEDGAIPLMYNLTETASSKYWVRTEQNVVDSDGTLILHVGELSGGTDLTHRMARKHGKPVLLIDLSGNHALDEARQWLAKYWVEVLNVAGPRESSSPGVEDAAKQFVERLLESDAGDPP